MPYLRQQEPAPCSFIVHGVVHSELPIDLVCPLRILVASSQCDTDWVHLCIYRSVFSILPRTWNNIMLDQVKYPT